MRACTALLGLLYAAAAGAIGTGQQVPPRPNAESRPPTSSVRSLYVVHCAGCHGMDGAGSRLGRVPDMRRLGNFLQLEGGRAFVVSVPGVMGSGLTDEQVADVTNWVLKGMARDSIGADFQPYAAEEVRQARGRPLADVAGTRARLVEQARQRGIVID